MERNWSRTIGVYDWIIIATLVTEVIDLPYMHMLL